MHKELETTTRLIVLSPVIGITLNKMAKIPLSSPEAMRNVGLIAAFAVTGQIGIKMFERIKDGFGLSDISTSADDIFKPVSVVKKNL